MLSPSLIHSVYICGLEIEEETGITIIEFLEENSSLPVFFSPGPRLMRITPDRIERIFALHPILHLNLEEARAFTQKEKPEEAAMQLFLLTSNTVIITLGKDGCYYYTSDRRGYVPGFPAVQKDTIGAGDAHIGAVMSALFLGQPIQKAIEIANRVSAAVVSVSGALLSDQEFASLDLRF